MMVTMSPDASAEQIAAVVARIEAASPLLHAQVVHGALQSTISAIGDPEAVGELHLQGMPGVDRVARISVPYKLASLQFAHQQHSQFEIGGRKIGPSWFFLIAGPCTVETRAQTLAVAQVVADAGASALRGGAFKPRTSPFAFQGLGQEGLDILAEARALTGLPIVTELTSTRHSEQVAAVADIIQVGARNMQNYGLLQAVGEIGKPVLLKRGLSSTCEELLMAADYILKEGNEQVVLCERGIRTFETALRFTLDLGAVAWLKAHTHLPVIVDPSHASGDRRFVQPLAAAAAAVGADGLIVEVAENPDSALCDAAQQLYASDFAEFVAAVSGHAALGGRALSGVVREKER